MSTSPYPIDFETEAIVAGSPIPPKPIGVAMPNEKGIPTYYSFDHAVGDNSTTKEHVGALLRAAWERPEGLVFHNAKFDIAVAMYYFDLPMPKYDKVHDTLLLLFLLNPNNTRLGLKESSEALLGIPPDEQDAVADYLVKNKPKGLKEGVSLSKKSPRYFAKYMTFCPPDVLGPYALGDITRTAQLFEMVYPKIQAAEMLGAYDRERKVLLALLDMEKQGVRLNTELLQKDVSRYLNVSRETFAWISTYLNAPEINLDADMEVLDVLKREGKIDCSRLLRTEKGNISMDKQSLAEAINDKTLSGMLRYWSQLQTCLKLFMCPWLKSALENDGLLHTNWNQVKSLKLGAPVGARTGRLSSSPNLQNIPKPFASIFAHDDSDQERPKCPIDGVLPLPNVRKYVIPYYDHHVLIDLDYCQQEFRVLAHYEDGILLDAFRNDTDLDMHVFGMQIINEECNLNYTRPQIKAIGFGLLYGMGLAKLAKQAKISVESAREVKHLFLKAFPGLKQLQKNLKIRAHQELPIRTIGGRLYYCEEPIQRKDGSVQSRDYKLLNTLIQGSAADCTKEAIARYYDEKPANHKLLLTVHDEILISAPKKEWKEAKQLLAKCMKAVPCDAPFEVSGSTVYGLNWGSMK